MMARDDARSELDADALVMLSYFDPLRPRIECGSFPPRVRPDHRARRALQSLVQAGLVGHELRRNGTEAFWITEDGQRARDEAPDGLLVAANRHGDLKILNLKGASA